MEKENPSTKESIIKSGKEKTVIAISSGDPGGIGPEIIFKALELLEKHGAKNPKTEPFPWEFIPIIIGDSAFYEKELKAMQNLIKVLKVNPDEDKIGPLHVLLRSGKAIFLDMGNHFSRIIIGEENDENARASYFYFKEAFNLVKNGLAHGMVTGPVNKGAIAKTGIPFTGHTDELTRFIKDEMALDKNPVMLMYAEKIRMLLLTTHIPISQVEKRLDILTSLEAIISAVKFLEMEHEKKRKIAILGIDPHSGDQGAIGNLDQEFTIPLIEKLKEENIQADGPISSDSFFAGEEYLKYGLIVSAYHDQGMIPFKIHCFGKGVNVTLNLPVKRTSPDHGTAYHLAGKKKADAGSMVKAIQLCLKWIQFEYDN